MTGNLLHYFDFKSAYRDSFLTESNCLKMMLGNYKMFQTCLLQYVTDDLGDASPYRTNMVALFDHPANSHSHFIFINQWVTWYGDI